MIVDVTAERQDQEEKQVRHLLIVNDTSGKQILALEENTYSLGRATENSVVLHSKQVSRHHATLLRMKNPQTHEDVFWIMDGGLNDKRSTNGLFVNGHKYYSKQLKHQDIIILGKEAKLKYYRTRELSEKDFLDYCESLVESNNESELAEAFSTLVLGDGEAEPLSEAALVRLASFPELLPCPIIEVNLNNQITYLNPAAISKFPDLKKLLQNHPFILGLNAAMDRNKINIKSREIEIDDRHFEQFIQFIPENALIRSYVFDITERKQMEAMLHYRAFYDLLTELPNRNSLNQEIFLLLNSSEINEKNWALMLVDLDRFKFINDTFGHDIGDKLLQQVAKRLLKCVRQGDIVARWGGDEFTLLIKNVTSREDVAIVAQRIIDSLLQPFRLAVSDCERASVPLSISTSIGIAIFPQDGNDSKSLFKSADKALYVAKDRGRNNYQFSKTLHQDGSSENWLLEHELEQAIQRGEFVVYYQPQIDTTTGNITELEALVRWNHPVRGVISPEEFIPIAEEMGLMVSIGESVLHQVCLHYQAWQRAALPPFRVGVNVSASEFQQLHFPTVIEQVLSETGLPSTWLNLELSETAIMQNADKASAILEKFQSMGIQVTIDDFGTGYASLTFLQKYRFNKIKISQSFVQDSTFPRQNKAFIAALVTLCRELDAKVVAEGVETPQQLEFLRSLHVDEMQGYFFTQPLTAPEMTQFLQNCWLPMGDKKSEFASL